MEEINFPIFKTKSKPFTFSKGEGSKGLSKKFDLTDFNQRRAYFDYKAGKEIKKLREYLKDKTFIAYFLGKKSSGKGTYSKMLKEVVAPDKIEHFSVGDMVRSFDEIRENKNKKKELVSFLEENYRGFMPLEDVIKSLEGRSTKTLLPTELILALVKREIEKIGRKAIFIDGFPRDLDQISYSLFFRDLVNYRQDPDIFVLINVPTLVIDERIKFRVVCPLCQTSRNLKLLATKKVEYEKKDKKFHLICDNPNCKGARMVTKEGDELGIGPIKERLNKDEILIKRAFLLQGIPKILLRNSIPVKKVKESVDDYEITPEYQYSFNKKENKVEVTKKPWKILDDDGTPSNSLMPPPVVVSLIKQLVKVLGL
jgi:adenylate kinase family enzyme